jgi:integrase
MSTTSDAILFEILEELRGLREDLNKVLPKEPTDQPETGQNQPESDLNSTQVNGDQQKDRSSEGQIEPQKTLASYLHRKAKAVTPQHLSILTLTLENYVKCHALTAAGCENYVDMLLHRGKSPKTINNALSAIAGYSRWVTGMDLTEGLKVKQTVRPQDQRKAFTKEEVSDVLSGLLTKDDTSNANYARRWLPILMAYTGARPEELAQLRVGDIKQVEGWWVFDLSSTDDGQRHKTAASYRLVPIHPRLFGLGLEKLYKGRPEGHLLFPELNSGASGRLSEAPCRYFNQRWLREAKCISDRKLTIYSLRHSVATRLKRKGVDDNTISQILGHAINTETSRYAKDHNLKALNLAINLLDWHL